MNILIYTLAAIAALQVVGFSLLLVGWSFCKFVARQQLKRKARIAAMEG